MIRQRLNQLGYRLKRVAKTKPQKVIAETEAIFTEVNRVNQAADADAYTLRRSIDAKATVKVGDYDRGGLKLTADCIVDRLKDWWQQVKAQFPHIRRWVINADNGPENSSRRTQFMHRLVALAQREQMTFNSPTTRPITANTIR